MWKLQRLLKSFMKNFSGIKFISVGGWKITLQDGSSLFLRTETHNILNMTGDDEVNIPFLHTASSVTYTFATGALPSCLSVHTKGAGSNCETTWWMKTARWAGRDFSSSMLWKELHSPLIWQRRRGQGQEGRIGITPGKTRNSLEKLFSSDRQD